MEEVLNNPVYHALRTGNRHLALGTDPILFFDPEVSPFVGFAELSDANFSQLYALVPAGRRFCFAAGAGVKLPPGWEILHCIPGIQMVSTQNIPESKITASLKPLSEEHVPQMVELARLTKPGPFESKTISFGFYEGIFEGSRLAAMTGQRFMVNQYAEISAVCTHPDFLGRGYARQLIYSQMIRIKSAGQIPFLHVRDNNERAIAIYKALGFTKRMPISFYFIRKLGN